ncbi:unnamed protein product [Paramecium octaurelia]|uniref:Uncharacterized protein n=1 Tax=Paramecium octaurelia TaxID=43137 RepID=A0A8S1U4P8_PAROT|nr:unnamed protein product [Paramecium octaurelia]
MQETLKIYMKHDIPAIQSSSVTNWEDIISELSRKESCLLKKMDQRRCNGDDQSIELKL